ncbi:Peptidoglycan/LPS O-acetylase OafA/YrhL, contains acyltransferase and SGNH-hydrolase domains [Pseudarcicella hirudinis]|uniref:Peptidoglycan/LPS O-acetylase OafA/YrhL, contains acyltransferase and SGNH-hydrolase domains n=1 Tax=Pseudarcicella hirudinis TaxID=1079859 RepID=A0A1I5Y6V5_9BACT|nr:acyltransferase [Pseudarcicella hirudinis]SFQ39903.1 Peptidoglycan/LPS O-acetylase OafA/YrhL, contains acyltransferase and SGNH-hydrolase domains [Pseudarcicella hirudinis]
MSSSKIINSIQLLRGIAAIVVVIYHISVFTKNSYSQFFYHNYFSIGFAGVDLFFVISGFIIHYTSQKYLNNPARFKEYLKKRFVRIYPIYWVTLGALVVVSIVLTDFLGIKLHTELPDTFSSAVRTMFLLPGHFAINAVSWTLSYELLFYAFFSLLIISGRFKVLGIICIIISLINGFYIKHLWGVVPFTYFGFFFSLYNVEFLFGYLLYFAYKKVDFSSLPGNLIVLAGSLGALIYWGGQVFDCAYYPRLIIFGIPAAFVVFSCLQLEKAGHLKVPDWCVLLGDASYVIYLIHIPALLLLNKLPSMFGFESAQVDWIGFNTLALFLIIIISVIIHKIIEKPLTTFLSRKMGLIST